MGAYRASIGKIARKEYAKLYKILLMRPDGSIIFGRCSEPRHMVQLPLDLKNVGEDERRVRLAARKPKVEVVKEEVIDDNFDFKKYAVQWKREAQS